MSGRSMHPHSPKRNPPLRTSAGSIGPARGIGTLLGQDRCSPVGKPVYWSISHQPGRDAGPIFEIVVHAFANGLASDWQVGTNRPLVQFGEDKTYDSAGRSGRTRRFPVST